MNRIVYYDKETCKYLNQDEYEKLVIERAEKIKNNRIAFSDWLDDNYIACEIFNFGADDKKKVMENYYDYCVNMAKESIDMVHLDFNKKNNVKPTKCTFTVWNKNVPMTVHEAMEYLESDTKAVGATCFVHDLECGIWYHCVLDYHYKFGLVALYGANDEEEMFKEKDYGKKWVAYEYMPVGM